MQNGKTIKTRKNVDFNVDIFMVEKRLKKFLTNVDEYDNLNKLFQTAKTKNLDN